MPYFPLTTLQEMALAFFLGLGAVVLLYAAWAFYPSGPSETGADDRTGAEGNAAKSRQADHPVPPFLIMLYIGVIVWILAYVIVVGLRVKASG